MTPTHQSPYAGRWYPGAAAELDRLLQDAFAQSQGRTGDHVYPDGVAYVVPHAGPVYSGVVAAAVYRTIARARPHRAVLLGFPHRGGLDGVALTDAHVIATPFGEVSLDRNWLSALPFSVRAEEQLCDHSVELQLPFLQHCSPRTLIAPIYVGRMSAEQRAGAAAALAAAWTPGTVFLASSDFTHYGRQFGFLPFPTDHRTPDRVRALDRELIEAASSLDPDLFIETLRRTGATVCGSEPIALLLDILRRLPDGELWQEMLDYDTSGEITGDWHHSVSYAALGYFPARSFQLSATDCDALVDAADACLRAVRAGEDPQWHPAKGGTSALEMRRAAFVTLRQEGRLLGCIGNCPGRDPLRIAIPALTACAALHDERFSPAARVPGEIDIDVSILSPMRRVRDHARFEPGRHGALLTLGAHRGVLLPEVATERQWDGEAFFEALSRKAGVSPQAWRDANASLFVFETQVSRRRSLPAGVPPPSDPRQVRA
jgi:AmmeMemoRadiSam system protein B/AmmeMemoRadiSam system protein A